ncbi:unnamed protein product [Urochloa humidicola]
MAAPAAGLRRAGGRFRAPEATTGGAAATGYHFLGGGGGGNEFARVLEEASAPAVADAPATAGREAPPAAPTASAMAARITPAVLFVTVVLAVVLLVSGLLHLLRRLFLKTHHGGAGAGERQLQNLFFPGGGGGEDGAGSGSRRGGGGLAQAAIDALPEFAYAELSAAASATRKGKEKAARPFDCAVCLCEFAGADRLRLLPSCGHAFHLACIDVWLRSTATCPLCRTKLSPRHLAAAAAASDEPSAGPDADEHDQNQAPDEASAAASSVVLPVRLGRFTCADGGGDDAEASTTTCNNGGRIDGARRCYSMGSYQYVLADEHLLVSVHMSDGNAAGGAAAGGGDRQQQQNQGGKKVFARGDSFSVSKIWQWRGSKRLPASLCADDGLPWAPAATHTRQLQRGDT